MTFKKGKKFFAITASTALVASAIVPVVSANSASFPDVAADSIYKEYIDTLAQQKIINGFPDGTFKPKVILKRRDVVTMLAKYMNVFQGEAYPSDFKSNIRFTDLKPLAGKDDDLLKFAALAYEKGIFQGYNGQLSYKNEITREEAGASVLRLIAYGVGFKDENQLIAFLQAQSDYKSKITDLDKASAWARESINALSYLEITNETRFNPKAKIPREQFAAFMYRAMNNTLNNEAFVSKAEAYLNANLPSVGVITITPDGGVLGISGAKPGDHYTIYDSSGRVLASGHVNSDGKLEIVLTSPIPVNEKIKIVVVGDDGSSKTIEVTPETTAPPAENKEQAITLLTNLINSISYVKTSVDGNDILKSEQWTTASAKQALEQAVAAANSIKGSSTATLADLNKAVVDLNKAISTYNQAKKSGNKVAGLEETKHSLLILIQTSETLKAEQFTEESWAVFKKLLDDAKILLANPNAAVNDLTKMIEDLNKSIGNLVSKDGSDSAVTDALKQTLRELMSSINNLKEADYTTVTWNVVNSEKNKAQDLVNKADATKEELSTAVDNFTKAINGLVKADDQDKNGLSDRLEQQLKDLLQEVAKLNKNSYTPDSWSTLENKLKEADGSYSNDAEIEAIIKGIQDAKNALVIAGDKNALNKLITDAGALKVPVSVNGSEIAPKNKWTNQAALTALETAISNAQQVANDANATADVLRKAVENLNNAILAYQNAMQNGTATLTVKALDHKGSLIASTSSNVGVGGLTNITTSSDFTAIGLGLLDVVSLDVLANNSNVNSSKFLVPENHRFSMDFNFTSSAVLGLSRKNLAIYKIEGNQLKRVWQDGYGSLSLLGIPIQSKYNFSVSNLMPGEYIFAVVRNDGLGAEVISGNTIRITDRELVKMTADINSQQSIVTTGINGNVILNNSFSANDVKVSKVNSSTFTTESTNQTVQGNYGTLTINPSTGAYSYKASGTPLAISKVETFEYTLVDNDGREGKSYIHIRFNQQGKPEFNWSATDLSAEINFGSTVSENGSTNLTYNSEAEYDYKSKSQTVNTFNASSRTVQSDLIGIPDNQSILSFNIHTTGEYNVEYEILDALNRPITIGNSTKNTIRTDVNGKTIEVKGLVPGSYKIRVSNLQTNINSTYGVKDIVVRHNKYVGTAVTGNIKSNDTVSNDLPLVFADIMIDGAKTIEGQYGAIRINPDGSYTYNTNYTSSVNLGSIFNKNVDFYPITGYIGKTEVFNYYYEKPNGEQIPAKLEIYINGTPRDIPFKSGTTTHIATNTTASASPSELVYKVANSGSYASTVDFE